jgi:hypothetical protein
MADQKTKRNENNTLKNKSLLLESQSQKTLESFKKIHKILIYYICINLNQTL